MTAPAPKPEGAWYTKPWFLISGAFLVLLIIVSVLILVLVPSSKNGKPAGQGTGADAGSVQPPADAAESVCGLPAGSQDVPRTEAPATTWDQLTIGETAITVPWAPNEYGPAQVNRQTGAPSCYAHSPTGALYAAGTAAQLSASQQFDALADMLAQGPAADEVRNYTPRPMDPDFSMWVAGYQFLSYSDDVAVVSIAASASNGAIRAWPMTLEWVDGDWKVLAPTDAPFTELESLNGFVGWSGGL
jgi:hypothetical protein